MQRHRDSQKRYYIKNATYFITTVTHGRFPYFEHDLLCELFVDELLLCQKIKQFTLYGYKINPDHVHLLIQPGDGYNFSEIMKSLKENFSRDANKMISVTEYEGDTSTCRLHIREFIHEYINDNNLNTDHVHIPKFKWHKSFHDHIIRDDIDFTNHIRYLKRQWKKHGLRDNKWLYVKR